MEKYNFGHDDQYLLNENLLGIDNYDDLEVAEQFAFMVRSLEIEQGKCHFQQFDLDSLTKLHHYLFQDVYTFAGKVRDVQLVKGDTRFCQMQFILPMCEKLFREMKKEPDWLTIEEAAKRLAYYKTELNMIHPFREGNGRTIRIFIRAYAKSKGYDWDFAKLDREGYMQAMIQSVLTTKQLEAIYKETLIKL